MAHRKHNWPSVNTDGMGTRLSEIYNWVRASGLPNSIQARQPLPTNLNIPAWEKELSGDGIDAQLLDFIKYGFPLGYCGPISDCQHFPNHKSANDFPDQIQTFIDKEIRLGGIVGPMSTPLFIEWSMYHTS